MLEKRRYIYTDLNQDNFPNEIFVHDLKVVYQEIENFFSTEEQERLFEEAGINIDENLFELYSDEIAFDLLSEIFVKMNTQVPRVLPSFSESDIFFNEEKKELELNLVFEVLGFEGKQFEFYGALYR